MAEQGFVTNSTGGRRKAVLCPPPYSRWRPIDEITHGVPANGVGVCATEQMPEPFLKMLKKRRFELIEAPGEGVSKHRCNLQSLGDGRVLTFAGNAAVNARLEALGPEAITPGLTQILKGGGGPHCLTFPLLRDA